MMGVTCDSVLSLGKKSCVGHARGSRFFPKKKVFFEKLREIFLRIIAKIAKIRVF